MHYQEFSKRIKEKYPQYNDIDDRELATKIVAKYPQYQVDFDDNRVAPQTVSTPQGTSNSSPIYPQVEQSPVSPQGTTFAEGMGRIGNAVSTGVGNFVDTVKANPMQFAKDSVNSFVVQPAKEFLGNVLNPDVKKSPWLALAGGIAKGAVELPQNIQNTVADIQDTYHGVEGMHNKWNYTDSIKEAVKSNPVTNLAYETVAEPMRNNEGLTTLAEFGGMGGAGIAPVKAISKLDNMAKVANQTARITAKLDDAQKLKYAKQIDKLAKKRVSEGAKAYINPALKEFNDNVLLGGALGALEGETLEERASNAVGGLATGAIAHGAVKGAGKAYNKAKPVINEVINGISEADWISKRIADIDSSLNTNISKNANELTQKRKEYRDLISKDTSLAKNLDQKNTEFLESLGELSEQENLELLERIKQGDKKYSYAEKKAERKQKAIEQQKARVEKEQQETKEFFDNLLEEENASTAPVSEVSNPVDINTPKLEGTTVKTHELPAGKKVHINANPKNKVGAEISKERYEELYGKDKKARQKELNEKWDLGREVTKEEFDQIKANKKSYKEKVARQRELAEQQGGFKPLEQPLSDISVSNATPSVAKNNRTIDRKGRVTVWNPDGTIKTRFKRTTKQQAPEAPVSVREELPLKQENWGKVEKLEPGEALGVKEANRDLYELRTKPQKNTNKLDADNNIIESPEYVKDKYVKPEDAQHLEDLLPSDKESLAKEIEAQNITKDVPRVNLKEDLVKSTPAQRMADKLHNERRQKTWKEKLKSRVKSLNDETQTKSMEELIYGDEKNQVKGASVKSSTAQAEANRAREMKQYEDIPVSNKAEFRDPITLEEVKIEKTKSNAGTTFSERINNIIKSKQDGKHLSLGDIWNVKKHSNIVLRKNAIWNDAVRDFRLKSRKKEYIKKNRKELENIDQAIKNGKKLDYQQQNILDGYIARKDAVDIFKPKHFAMANKDYAKLIKGKGIDNLNIIITDNKKIAGGARGQFNRHTNDIIIHRGNRTEAEIVSTIMHESQHAMDIMKIKSLPDNHPYKVFFEENANDYKAIVDYLTDNNLNLQREHLANQLVANKLEHLLPFKNDKFIIDNLQEYATLLNEEVIANHITPEVADFLYKDAEKLRRYYDDFFEARAFNTENNIKNGDLFYELGRHIQKSNGGNILNRGYARTQGQGHIAYRSVQQTEHRPHSGKNVQTNNREKGFLELDSSEFNQPTDTYSKFESKSAEVRGAKWVADKLNKDILQAKLDDGEITQEQATNRLIQQGGGEDAVYLKQISSKQGKIIFGEKENTKVGIYGEKKSDGLAIKGSAQKYLANRFEEHIRIQRDQNIIKFLKENFSNQQKKGFVPVNTKLLRIAMTRGFSKAWYETLVKGESAIREVFPNEAQAKAWVDLSTRTKANEADLYIPEDLFEMSITGEKELPLDYLKTYGRKIGINQFKAMGKIAGAMLDYYNDRFKRKVLTSASFFTNNRFGNQIMLMANASSPAEYFRSIKDAIKLKDSDIPTEILESTLAETIQQELGGDSKLSFIDGVNEIKKGNTSVKRYFSNNQNNFLDNIVRLLDGTYIDAKQFDNPIHKAIAHSINGIIAEPNAWFKQLSNTMMGINAKAERFERKQAFAQTLNKIQKDKVTQTARKMATVKHLIEEIKSDSILRQTVIDKVADVLGDYNNFNKFEKNFMKRIIPFYAWNRTILRHSIALCKDNPTKLALIALKTLELHTQDDGLEDYQHGALKTGIYDKTAGKNLVINKTKMIPYATLFDMIDTIRGKAPGGGLGQASPMIKKTWEAIKGEKQFKPSSEIQNKRYKRMSHKGQNGYLDTKTGEFKEGGLPAGARLAYLGKDALETVYPHIGSPLTKGVLSKDVIEHHNKTGEWRLPDKQYDASLGGFYDGDYIGSYNGKAKKRSAKMKMDLGHQVANRLTGLGLQPEQRKAKKEKWKKQSRKLRGY